MIHLPLPPGQPLVLFTDLDGTLIDHHTYSADGSREALRRLASRGIPVVFCSTKTFAEQIYLQQELRIFHPFIFENGSAVAVPKGYFKSKPIKFLASYKYTANYELFSLVRVDVVTIRAELARFQNIRGFSDAPDAEISGSTGLTDSALQRAKDRQFTETLITSLQTADIDLLSQELAKKGLALSRGGRFHTVQPAQADKGKAVQWLKKIFRKNTSGKLLFAATGDSPNDAPMLKAVDLPFLVQRFDGTWATMDVPGMIRINAIGPAGFSAAVSMLLGE